MQFMLGTMGNEARWQEMPPEQAAAIGKATEGFNNELTDVSEEGPPRGDDCSPSPCGE